MTTSDHSRHKRRTDGALSEPLCNVIFVGQPMFPYSCAQSVVDNNHCCEAMVVCKGVAPIA